MFNRSIEMYPNGHLADDIAQISLFLRRKDSICMEFNAKYKLIMGRSKESVLVKGSTSGDEFKEGGYGRQQLLSHEKLAEFESEYIEDNNLLLVVCEVRILLIRCKQILIFFFIRSNFQQHRKSKNLKRP